MKVERKNLIGAVTAALPRYSKWVIILVCIVGTLIDANAINKLHFTSSPDGDMPIMLFPTNGGFVNYSETYEVNGTAEEAIDIVKEFITALSTQKAYKIKTLSESARAVTYDIAASGGEEDLSLEIWGSPVFIFSRSASVVKFKMTAMAKNGKLKVVLDDFETNRNTIRGRAKNDGDPNIIHWQRVNSLHDELWEEIGGNEPTKRKHYSESYDYNSRIASEFVKYANEYNLVQTIVDNLSKVIKNPDSLMDNLGRFSPDKAIVAISNVNDFANPHLFDNYDNILFYVDELPEPIKASDNLPKIYGSSGKTDHEKAGKSAILKNIIVDSVGQVVFDKSKADYVFNYSVQTEGKDKAILEVYDSKGTLLASKQKGASESNSENREVGESLYKSTLKPILEK